MDEFTARIVDTLYANSRLEMLRVLQGICEKGVQQSPVTEQTMTEFFTVVLAIIGFAAPSQHQYQATNTLNAVTKFFEHLSVQGMSGGLKHKAPPLSPEVEKFLRGMGFNE